MPISNRKAIAYLKAAMLSAQTLGELHALIEDYSYMEFMQIYKRLTPEQQAKLNAIDEFDHKTQLG
jgi:Spy/CpxP family protein refolding chaperone